MVNILVPPRSNPTHTSFSVAAIDPAYLPKKSEKRPNSRSVAGHPQTGCSNSLSAKQTARLTDLQPTWPSQRRSAHQRWTAFSLPCPIEPSLSISAADCPFKLVPRSIIFFASPWKKHALPPSRSDAMLRFGDPLACQCFINHTLKLIFFFRPRNNPPRRRIFEIIQKR